MKIILTGSLGHIGKPLTATLVNKGHTVTVISSKPERKRDIEAMGAIAAIGSIEDAGFLTAAFTGADAVYCMLPPPNFLDVKLDLAAACRNLTNNYAQAIQQSGVKRVVHLSSIGAHMEKDSGLILIHRAVEDVLGNLPGIGITHLRPTAFYYNLYGFIPGIKNTGVMASNYGAEDKISWVSPIDIAAAVAEEIVTALVGRKVRYVASEERTGNEVAAILGAAIGKPGLKWIVISNEQMQSGLEAIGMPPLVAAGLVEMNASMHNGELFRDYYQHRPVMGNVKLADFATEFAAAYKQ